MESLGTFSFQHHVMRFENAEYGYANRICEYRVCTDNKDTYDTCEILFLGIYILAITL